MIYLRSRGNIAAARSVFSETRKLIPLPPIWIPEFEAVASFVEGEYAAALPGVEAVPDGAWDNMYALSCCGHLGLKERADAHVERLRAQGRSFDFAAAARFEPFVDRTVNERLLEGLHKAGAA